MAKSEYMLGVDMHTQLWTIWRKPKQKGLVMEKIIAFTDVEFQSVLKAILLLKGALNGP